MAVSELKYTRSSRIWLKTLKEVIDYFISIPWYSFFPEIAFISHYLFGIWSTYPYLSLSLRLWKDSNEIHLFLRVSASIWLLIFNSKWIYFRAQGSLVTMANISVSSSLSFLQSGMSSGGSESVWRIVVETKVTFYRYRGFLKHEKKHNSADSAASLATPTRKQRNI